MIKLYGARDTSEWDAATELRRRILETWPDLVDHKRDTVHIIAGAKCFGQKVRDVDLLIFARFPQGRVFKPFLDFQSRGEPMKPEHVTLSGLLLAIEVKDHPPEGIRFSGPLVRVSYGTEWKDASDQSHQQIFSVINYLKSHRLDPPRVNSLVWLRNVPNTELPPRPHGNIGQDPTWELILNVVMQNDAPYRDRRSGAYRIDAFHKSSHADLILEVFTRELKPTRLDKIRMMRLNEGAASEYGLRNHVGQRLLLLRGQGGTGKTVCLLQLAKQLADEEDARTLLLTYNRALVSDIRRLLTLMGVPTGEKSSGIQAQTVHSFVADLGRRFGLLEPEDDFLVEYSRLKNELLQWFAEGAATREDLALPWDYIFVDEGQDWPDDERRLLMAAFSPKQLVIADGKEQLVRSIAHARWREGLTKAECKVVPLKKCLRMKANLSRFVSFVSRELGYPLNIEVCHENSGGKVYVTENSYLSRQELHSKLVKQNEEWDNERIDMLFCVPPSLVREDEDGQRSSVATDVFETWGEQVWDGTDPKVRGGHATDFKQLRLLQYESCRGLEGWTVVNLALDDFYASKREEFLSLQRDSSDLNIFAQAEMHAARWVLIPLTRALDTIVIQLDGAASPLAVILKRAANRFSDFMEWI